MGGHAARLGALGLAVFLWYDYFAAVLNAGFSLCLCGQEGGK